ncbi:bacterial regulatory, Fis family protein [Burkholderia ambifaria AMMD]|uniref:Helix-turn-helix, Fis-type n=1 Tax=Burkholderia ambifaria (strain ATCC BAA-244 / DSM 16087 / CCUG 44356 / LMG 19182 / AMMD) TaxID=339670 RepID=Q0BD16_BURCM|nr:helix-turn-helix domain-containing protein [Burkholderia ambifaria]ABI87957.1 helix-turn-helix, Fis-type [Burkholderia ambifaria AMMD]AJY22511.1 bacterial regulatory, Fis family protein [Burkholderia ambifaria AMMD]MBR7932699.1 hypothetical protein [Burkholderia ambifaria]PEH64873.1 hypothetical protein CRM91_20850 [Burkholderia ambifaria]QQC04851.1 hypothetical protein I6H84_02755 [Burkholderia ambifaria]
MTETTFAEPGDDLPPHLCPLFIMAAYPYMQIEDRQIFADGLARLTNALIIAGTKGELAVFHPKTLLPYDAHNAGFEDEPSPVTADWVARINDVLHWFVEKNIEAAKPLVDTMVAHVKIEKPMSVDRRTQMMEALERNGGNKTKTATEFGISRQRLAQIIQQGSAQSIERKGLAVVPHDPFGVAPKAK